ncbi:MAG: AAA family ATPase [Planctomycetes bacterium]|nr:AAA family ATPase [Planctomycetota bacterium]
MSDLPGINRIEIEGFKSLREKTTIDIRPLTIIAGANSAGKSSAMQPLLLLKQTLEATFDPGSLLLDGPNVRYTDPSQFLSRQLRKSVSKFAVRIAAVEQIETFDFTDANAPNRPTSSTQFRNTSLRTTFVARPKKSVDVEESEYRDGDGPATRIFRSMGADELAKVPDRLGTDVVKAIWPKQQNIVPQVHRERFLLTVKDANSGLMLSPDAFGTGPMEGGVADLLRGIIHVPGLRGNPGRSYVKSATGPLFPGTFENYVAGLVQEWESSPNNRLDELNSALNELGLTWKIATKYVDATKIELQVGRTSRSRAGGAKDLVSIADVGFGLSQVLPVIVALLVASPGTLVYIEQPEIHLHPRAQKALAVVLADAARRGVRVVAETHSSILLLSLRTLIAQGMLDPGIVKLHWFTRSEEDGTSEVRSSNLDSEGAFGDWPEDFGQVELQLQQDYLDAVERRLIRKKM